MALYEPIVGFSREMVNTVRYIDLHSTFVKGGLTKIIHIQYFVVDASTSYKIQLGQPSLNLFGTFVPNPHITMKFPSSSHDIIAVHEDQTTTYEFYIASLRLPIPHVSINNVEKESMVGMIIEGKNLDPIVGSDARGGQLLLRGHALQPHECWSDISTTY